jgi:carbonic anhydrase
MISRRSVLKGFATGAAALALSRVDGKFAFASEEHGSGEQKGHGEHEIVPPYEAITLLSEGNERYVSMNRLSDPGVGPAARKPLTKGQWPYATILGCSDSRVPPELIFDEGLGRLFIIRNAGNIIEPVALGSIEYASLHSTSRLVVVLCHESCGAVGATVKAFEHPSAKDTPAIDTIIQTIMPAVEKAKKATGLSGKELVDAAAKENARMMIAKILEESKALKKMVEHGELKVIGGYYSLETGKVELWA